jgi:hypothetical protein
LFDFRESAEFLKKCQVLDKSDIDGTVCPWELNKGDPPREDLHDTLEALYIWTRKENRASSALNIRRAIEYAVRKFEWYKGEDEPLKSYDSIYYSLALHSYLSYTRDDSLQEIEDYAERYLVEYFKGAPKHNAREYSNPYWKAGILALVLMDRGEDTEFLRKWLEGDLSLPDPSMEEEHKGRGYQYPHDFVSTFGTKLFAMNLLRKGNAIKGLSELIPSGFIHRPIDEISYNSSILYGLCTIDQTSFRNHDSIREAISSISNEIERKFDGGGIKRGDYTRLRESWPTFFYYFAAILCRKLPLFD